MTALDIEKYYNDMYYVYDRLAELEKFKENFERYEQPRVQQAYIAADDFYAFRDDYNRKSFEFVDIKKN